MNILVNIIIYQLIWLLCVFFQNYGVLPALCLLVLHLYLSPVKKQDGTIMVILLLSGIIIDGSLQAAGVLQFTGQKLPIPFWLATIWLALATLIHHSLRWLKKRYLLSAIFGAIGGPLAYWAGVRAEAAAFGIEQLTALAVITLVWFLIWPLAMFVGEKLLPVDAES